uniref:Reticulocalbin-3 n=1 Tax=Hirondellea gigas TaxID=1518452 RepID=A0A2P2ICV1_9CRUS
MMWLLLVCTMVAAVGPVLPHNIDKALHRERESDGSFASRADEHSAGGPHDSDFDHESILGSSKDAEEFDHLPAEESKERLELLLIKMDTNADKIIDSKEMYNWIMRSFKMLSKEESSERFEDTDEDGDSFVTWQEHLKETYGIEHPDDVGHQNMDQGKDTTRMMAEDRQLFTAADKDGDEKLNEHEFLAFSHPEEDETMVPLLVDHAMQEKDTNQDNKISFTEYIAGQQGVEHDDEGLLAEKDRFDEDYDKNMDGELDLVEVRHWIVPDNQETATSETEHLFANADDDEDGVLSFDEVLSHHDLFVGSEVTDYGDHLHNLDRFDDEL